MARADRPESGDRAAALRARTRTYVLGYAAAVAATAGGRRAEGLVPEMLTLFASGAGEAGRERLFLGTAPVAARDLCWDPDRREVGFAGVQDGKFLRGQLVFTFDGLRAQGTVSVGGHCVAVEYRLAPQRRPQRVGAAAAA